VLSQLSLLPFRGRLWGNGCCIIASRNPVRLTHRRLNKPRQHIRVAAPLWQRQCETETGTTALRQSPEARHSHRRIRCKQSAAHPSPASPQMDLIAAPPCSDGARHPRVSGYCRFASSRLERAARNRSRHKRTPTARGQERQCTRTICDGHSVTPLRHAMVGRRRLNQKWRRDLRLTLSPPLSARGGALHSKCARSFYDLPSEASPSARHCGPDHRRSPRLSAYLDVRLVLPLSAGQSQISSD
jgi:hypothetical protein